jgi:hypothetical protein
LRNHPAIGQNHRIALNRPHLDEFAIDEPFADRVGLQQQLVAGSNFQFLFLPHIKAGATCTQWEKIFRTIVTLDFDRIIFDRDHRNRFVFGKIILPTMKPDCHAGTILPRILLLRFRPRQRIKNLKFLFLTGQPARFFHCGPDFFRDRLDFIPSRCD